MDDLKLAIDSNFALKSTKDWFLREAPYDVIIQVDGVSFPLHKAPLVSRSGLMRRLVMEDEDCSQLELMRLPGGAHGFELAAKFCYSVKLEVHAANVALLRCVAEHLEMTEDYGVDNLVLDAEAYLEDILRKDFTTVIRVLHSCDKLLPLAEQLHIVARSVDAAASLLINFRAAPSSTRSSIDSSSYYGGESTTSIDFDMSARSSRSSNDFNPNNSNNGNNKGLLWWMEDLSTLSLPLFDTMIKALVSKGLPSQTISRALLHYAHKCFEGLAKEQAMTWHTNFRTSHHHHVRSSAHENDPQQQKKHESKVLETIVSLLPSGEKNAVPLNLLLELLQIALLLHLPGTCNCRVNLERRIALRLHHATLDDLLIPSFSKEHGENGGGGDGTTYDVEATRRLLTAFLQLHANGDFSSSSDDEDEDDVDQNREGDGKVKRMTPISMTKVAYLVDSYLAEVAPDSHLSAAEFTTIANLLPEHARALDDGIYRAVDIYLKAHPALTDEERKKLCKVVDFHKLSHDACVHAAQNERLPLPTVVQVLYLEQMKIRDEISVDHVPNTLPISHPSPLIAPNPTANHHLALVPTTNSESLHETSHNNNHHHHNSTNSVGALIVHPAVSCVSSSNSGDHYASVRRENMELKLEVARMRMRLCDIEKEHTNMKHDMEKTHTDHEHHSSQHSDHLNDRHTPSQTHTASEHHTPQHSSHHPPPAASMGGSNSSSNHGHHHQHHHGGFFHAVSKTLSKLNVFHHPKHDSHHHEEHDRTDEHADHADHAHQNNHHHQSRSPNHHSSHHKSPSNHHHHRHHHSSHHKSPSHHHHKSPSHHHHSSSHHKSPSHHSSSHHRSPSHHSNHHRSPSHHSNHHRSPSHHSSHHRSPSHHSSHHKSPSHHHHHHHSSHHKSPSHHSHHSSHHKSPSHHSHHHSSHHKSPSHHRHHSSHHRRDSATPSPEHHSSHSRHHASPSPADHHSSHSHHKSPNNRSRHSSSSSEHNRETSRHRHYSPSPDHRSHHSSHSRHRSSEHDGHHHHRSHHHHNREHHGHGHSHHGHRRHHSPSSNSSTSPVRERDHHSRSSSPDRHHHHSLHRSPSPDYQHHRSHHKSHEHHHRSSRSPTPHHHGHGHHSTAHHSSSSRDHHHRSQHHSHNHHSDNDHHVQESDHHGHHGHHQGHHIPDPSHLHEALKATGNQHEGQHSDHHHHHGHHKDHQSQEGRKR